MKAIDKTTGKRINIDKNKLSIANIQEIENNQTDITILDVVDPNNIDVHLTEVEQNAFNGIIKHITEGNSLANALETIQGLEKTKMYRCINLDAHKRNIYARATEEREAVLFEKTLLIAMDNSNDMYMNEKGVLVPNPVAVQRSRLLCDVIDKMLARMNRKKYGNSTTLRGDVDNPVVIQAITGMIIE